ncbi:MAG: SDR family oxidoreductase [Verrucomicrobia bacterium]|nr:SDR family oxidoreductase [Verrucomicrobiota bacterium]
MPNYPELRNQTVLITGGANGIGAAMVRAFARQHAKVFFADMDVPAAEKLAHECGGMATFAKVDLRKEREIKRWVDGVGQRSPRIDVVINNAASDPRMSLEETTAAAWDELFARNLRAYFLVCRAAVKRMRAGGSIINFSSVTIHNGPPNLSAYVATKGGIWAFTRALARELGPRGIRVNTISPGWVMTERQLRQYVDAAARRLIRASQCIDEFIQPEEIAEVALFLASPASRAMTGQELLVDRGWEHS